MASRGRVHRARLLEACGSRQIVLLSAPYGTGKTVLAGQLAAAGGGTCVTVRAVSSSEVTEGLLRAGISDAWQIPIADGDAEGDLASVCAAVRSAGTVVLDGLEAMAPAAACEIVSVLVSALPASVRLVACTSDSASLAGLDRLKLRADGRLVELDTQDLLFDSEEMAELGASGRYGGWPVAEAAGSDGVPPDDFELCAATFTAAPAAVRGVLALVARSGVVAEMLLDAVAGPALREAVTEWTSGLSPAIAAVDEGVLRFTAAATAAACHLPRDCAPEVDVDALDAAAAALDEVCDAGAAVELLLDLGRWQAASDLLTRRARALLEGGAGTRLLGWVKRIPEPHRTLVLTFASACAGLPAGDTGVADLEVLQERVWQEDPELGPWASATLLWTMLGLGDERVLGFCATSLTRVLGAVPRASDLERRLATLAPSSRVDALRLVMGAVQILLLTRLPAAHDQARSLAYEVEQSLLRLGRSAEEVRALYVVGDMFTGGRVPQDPAISLLPSVDSSPRTTGMWCLLRLLYVAVRSGDTRLLAALTDRLESWLAADPDLCAGDVCPPSMTLQAMRYFLSTLERRDGAASAEVDVDRMWHAHLVHHTNSARVSALLVAVCLLEVGDVEGARFWYLRASERRDGRFLLLGELDVLEQRLRLCESGDEDASRALEDQVAANRRDGHPGSVAILVRWLVLDLAATGRVAEAGARLCAAEEAGDLPPAWVRALRTRLGPAVERAGEIERTDAGRAIPRLRLLAPEVTIEDGNGAARTVRGRQGMLVALLVTLDGRVEVDRAVDLLFGDIDVDSGRQRLYTAVYRTRKQLCLGPETLRVEDGVVRLGGDGLTVDVWEFESGVTSAAPGTLAAALDLYRDHLCSRQFAYESFVQDPRRVLRASYVRGVLRSLRGRLGQGNVDDSVADLARRAWQLVPDDAALCDAVARVLVRAGYRREAFDVVESTATKLEELGLPAPDLAELLTGEVGAAP